MIQLILKSSRGTERELARIERADPAARRAIRRAFFELGRKLRDGASREILHGRKTGRTYFVRGPGGRRRRHIASAPGETHANLTGKLRRSIGWKVKGIRGMDFGYGVAGRHQAPVYDEHVEFGTGRMEPRPSLDNEIRRNQRDLQRDFSEAMDRAMRGDPLGSTRGIR